MIISFVNQKGGVGKTTSAINIAASLKRKNYNVGFIDADPQGSATQWHAVENNNAFEVMHHPEPLAREEIQELSQKYDYLVIDAPPCNRQHNEINIGSRGSFHHSVESQFA